MIGVNRFAVSQGGAQFLGTRGTFVDVVIACEEVDHDLDPMFLAQGFAPRSVSAEDRVVVRGLD